MDTYTYKGAKYYYNNGKWLDESFLTPPVSVISELNKLVDEDTTLKNVNFGKNQLYQKTSKSSSKKTGSRDSILTLQKKKGECNGLFFVMESAIDKEREFANGRYLWCPKEAASGFAPHHYKRMQSLQTGNIVFHYSDGYVTGISTVKDKSYSCEKPYILLYADDNWEDEGWRADVDYILFPKRIRLDKYREELADFSTTKYSPFDKDGRVNIGYLFELPINAAKFLIDVELKLYPKLNDDSEMEQITNKIMNIQV